MPVRAARSDKTTTTKNRGQSSRASEPRHRGAVAPFAKREAPPANGGAPLETSVRKGEEARTMSDLGSVRVHRGDEAARRTESANARALTIGENIFPSPRAPDLQKTPEGRVILRHELQHVLESRRDPSLRETALRIPEDQLIVQLEQKLTVNDVPGFLQLIRAETGAHSGSAVVRTALTGFLGAGRITNAQAWRAVALQILGNEVGWAPPIKNFVEGVESGVFTPPAGMPPATATALTETALLTANLAAASLTDFDRYRAEFNARWTAPRFTVFGTMFDPYLDSRGPRNRRAREIFQEVLASSATFNTAYAAGGITRHRIDEYQGPEGANLEASPRLELLRREFIRSPLVAATTTDPAYVTFQAAVQAVAQNLDAGDRQSFERSADWRLLIDGVVTPTALRDDITETIRRARPPAPAAGGGVPAGGGAPAGGVAPPLVLTADQQTFVSNLTLTGPATPRASSTITDTLVFNPASSRDPAGLNVRSRVEVTPPGQVQTGQQSERPWPPAALAGAPHSAVVETENAAGFTDFTGSLTVVPATGTITQTARTAAVRLNDNRRAFFIANAVHGLQFSDQNVRRRWTPASVVSYYGGQVALRVVPELSAGTNPGLTVFVDASFSRNGSLLQTLPRVRFGRTASSTTVGQLVVLESVPASASADAMELTVRFFPSADPAAGAFHTITRTFDVEPGSAFTNAAVLAQLIADWTLLNATGAGSYLAEMTASGGQAARLSESIRAGNVIVEPMLIRADSASFVGAARAQTDVAFAFGHTVIDAAHTHVRAPGPDAMRLHRLPTTLLINLTPTLSSPATKRSPSVVIDKLVHESIHALDYPRVPANDLERYKTEFRAYWMDGHYDVHSTALDPAMSAQGPKSPKSREIFEHLYNSPTYSYVKRNYDANTNHFREHVNAYVVPDGINLIASPRLDNLRNAIEGYAGAGFPAHSAAVQTLFDATNPLDRREIAGNPIWRELVLGKYASIERSTILTMLRIPR